jgi:Icc-related predicted phosphoesterase
MLLVSDVHGAFDDLARVAHQGEPLVMLGDFVNFVDYRTNDGILADVLGHEFVGEAAKLRANGDYVGSRRLWRDRFGAGNERIRDGIKAGVERQYAQLSSSLIGARGYATFGNVDWPALLERSLPAGVEYVDGEAFELEGIVIGLVGGGAPTPLGVPGEVSEWEFAEKLRDLGPVDILCTHLPPAVPALRRDVITGRLESGSQILLEYLMRHRPRYHYFGDIHQPQASRWRIGPTLCINVGYFRATRRAVRHVDHTSYAGANRERE